MIKLKNLTPSVYYNESRDFQYIGRLFDVVLNSIKTSVDNLYSIPFSDNSPDKLLDLLALTLGFKTNHKYNYTQLRALCSVFSTIMKNKGSINSVIIACNALFAAEGLTQTVSYDMKTDADEKNVALNLYIPEEFENIPLINDLLDYILPAGMCCNIIRELQIKATPQTPIYVNSTIKVYEKGRPGEKPYNYEDNKLGEIYNYNSDINISQNDATKDNSGFVVNTGIYKQ